MPEHVDTAIIGLGAMGSATALELAARGQRVLGIEQFGPGGHALGSSHGESRIYRQAYFEGSAYVPMLLRAAERWRQLERDSGKKLFEQCGGLFMGRADSSLVRGSLDSCRVHDLGHELLDAAEIRRRFPRFHPPDDFVGLHEAAAGYLHPERAVQACQELATAHGAELRFHERIASIDPATHSIMGSRNWTADHIVVTAGAWTARLLPEIARFLTVKRVPLHWFRTGDAGFTAPAHAWEFPDGRFFYGPPVIDGRLKLAFHQPAREQHADPDTVNREVDPAEVDAMRDTAGPVLPGLCERHDHSAVCLYTLSPDEHFIIDRHPAYEHLLFATGFSGHGFKFMPVIGELLADLAGGQDSPFDRSPFRLDRFSA